VPSDVAPSPQEIAARYFEMWNTGDSSIATEILSPQWVDHAHPEVTGPDSVRQAVEDIRVAQPGLRFDIESILADGGGLVAVVGAVRRGAQLAQEAPRLIWLIRLADGLMTEMWTYRDTSR
jgi:SnoaL-like domain